MSARWSLSITPVKVAGSQHNTISAYNTGQTPLALTVTTAERIKVHGQCQFVNNSPKWAKLTPSSIHLAPGHHQAVRVTITHQPSKPVDLAVVFHTQPGAGSVAVAEDVAAQVAVGTHPACIALPASGASSLPLTIAALSLCAVLLSLAVIAGRRLFWRRGGDGTHRRTP